MPIPPQPPHIQGHITPKLSLSHRNEGLNINGSHKNGKDTGDISIVKTDLRRYRDGFLFTPGDVLPRPLAPVVEIAEGGANEAGRERLMNSLTSAPHALQYSV